MNMIPVISSNVGRVGYDQVGRTMRVEFLSGGVYEYFDVSIGLFEEMLRPYPWRRVGRIVRAHICRQIV